MNFGKQLLSLSLLLTAFIIPACAQRKAAPVNSSSAPVPDPILKGKRAFISFELGDVSAFPSLYSGGPERAYSEFYTAMNQWGRYELVSDPKDADVIFAIRFVESPGLATPQIRVGISDSRGRVSLWGFSEEINMAFRKKNRDAAFSQTVTQLVTDIQKLTAPNYSVDSTQP
jgi:hypothetical protein